MKQKAFTLIELLVVVLIIGILAAVAVPQYRMAVLRAKFTNLKLLHTAIQKQRVLYHDTTGVWPNRLDVLGVDFSLTDADSCVLGTGVCGVANTDFSCTIYSGPRLDCGISGEEFSGISLSYNQPDFHTDRPACCYHYAAGASGEKLCRLETGGAESDPFGWDCYLYP